MSKYIISIFLTLIGCLLFQLGKMNFDEMWFSKLSKIETQCGQMTEDFRNTELEVMSTISKLETKLAIDNSKPRDCQDIQDLGNTSTGIYTIYPGLGNNAIRVRCDMHTTVGGWTVFQRRISSSDFFKTWNEYQVGFGDLETNFWLGNQQLHLILSQGWYQLRVDLTSWDNEHLYAEYQVFSVGDAETKYKLFVDGYSGNAGDSFTAHSGMMFTTKDRDNDIAKNSNCAKSFFGAWWYTSCYASTLNAYYEKTEGYGKGIVWSSFKGLEHTLKKTEMKIRRGQT